MCFRWSHQETEPTVMATPHPVTCWTFSCRNRRTLTLALVQLHLAPWARDQAQVQALDLAQDRAQAVAHQLVELLAAEQVGNPVLDKTISTY